MIMRGPAPRRHLLQQQGERSHLHGTPPCSVARHSGLNPSSHPCPRTRAMRGAAGRPRIIERRAQGAAGAARGSALPAWTRKSKTAKARQKRHLNLGFAQPLSFRVLIVPIQRRVQRIGVGFDLPRAQLPSRRPPLCTVFEVGAFQVPFAGACGGSAAEHFLSAS